MTAFADRGGWWVAGQVVVIFLAVWAFVAVGPRLDPPAALRWAVAAPLLAAAGWLWFGGLWALGTALTPFPEPLSDAGLITRGPYRWVRHPIYGAIVIGATALAVLRPGLWPLLAALALFAYFSTKAAFEERRLLARYPEYADYRREVRGRVLPFVG